MFSQLKPALAMLALTAVFQAVFSQSITRLYIPGFDSQSAIGGIIKADTGRTTWSLDDQNGKTVTLVSGSNFATAIYTASGGAVTKSACSITLALALCATSTALESAIAVETPTLVQVRVEPMATQIISVPTTSQTSSALSITPGGPSKTLDDPAARVTSVATKMTPYFGPAWTLALATFSFLFLAEMDHYMTM